MDIKEKVKKVLFPHEFLIFILVNISIVGLVLIFMHGLEEHPVAYVMYMLSFYALVIVCVRIPGIVKWWKRKLHENKFRKTERRVNP